MLGHLGRDPSPAIDVNQETCATVSLATTFKWRDRDTGDFKESTEWHNLVFPPDLAQSALHELKKGTKTWITGRLHTRKWNARDGSKRSAVQVIVESYQDMSKDGTTFSSAQDYYAQPAPQQQRQPRPAAAPTPVAPSTPSTPSTYARAKG